MAQARQRGWWYPWIFVGLMGLVVVVNAIMATLAVKTFPGLQSDDAYNEGLRYNDTLAAQREQGKRGWRMDVQAASSVTSDGRHDAEVTVSFVDRDGYPVDYLSIDASLIRPTAAGFDQALSFERRAAGLYVAKVALPFAGQWDARINAHRDEETYQTIRRLFVK